MNNLKEKLMQSTSLDYAKNEGRELNNSSTFRTECLMKKPLSFHDNGARAEWLEHKKYEDKLMSNRMDEMDKDWHKMIADPELDKSIMQVSLFQTNEMDKPLAYRVEFPEEEVNSKTLQISSIPLSS